MEQWEVAAREGIRDTIHTYAHLVDTGRFEEFVQLFTEDGVLAPMEEEPGQGRAGILAAVKGFQTRVTGSGAHRQDPSERAFIHHHVSSIHFDRVTPQEAQVRCYFLAITHRGPDHWGSYRDRLVSVNGRWLFALRSIRTYGRTPDSP